MSFLTFGPRMVKVTALYLSSSFHFPCPAVFFLCSFFCKTREQVLELGVRHTLAFVIFASGMLMLLFFFDLGLTVTILFCLSATTATSAIAILPSLRRVRSALVDAGVIWSGEHVNMTVKCFRSYFPWTCRLFQTLVYNVVSLFFPSSLLKRLTLTFRRPQLNGPDRV